MCRITQILVYIKAALGEGVDAGGAEVAVRLYLYRAQGLDGEATMWMNALVAVGVRLPLPLQGRPVGIRPAGEILQAGVKQTHYREASGRKMEDGANL
jgi:hypothetical protein